MGWTSKSCCCCISVKTGTILLGAMAMLGLLQEIEHFYPMRLAANGISTVAFVLMLLDDTDFKRKLFFYCFMLSSLFMYCFGLYDVF